MKNGSENDIICGVGLRLATAISPHDRAFCMHSQAVEIQRPSCPIVPNRRGGGVPTTNIQHRTSNIQWMCGVTLRPIDNNGDYIKEFVSYDQAT